MKYLALSEIGSYLNIGKELECFLKFGLEEGYHTIEWYSIVKEKVEYVISKHIVFDERDEIGSVYDFTYVEPDDLYGLEVKRTINYEEILNYFQNIDNKNMFTLFGELDNIIG